MIPQMKAEEITTQDLDKNIFYGPIKNFPKTLLRHKKINFQRFTKRQS